MRAELRREGIEPASPLAHTVPGQQPGLIGVGPRGRPAPLVPRPGLEPGPWGTPVPVAMHVGNPVVCREVSPTTTVEVVVDITTAGCAPAVVISTGRERERARDLLEGPVGRASGDRAVLPIGPPGPVGKVMGVNRPPTEWRFHAPSLQRRQREETPCLSQAARCHDQDSNLDPKGTPVPVAACW